MPLLPDRIDLRTDAHILPEVTIEMRRFRDRHFVPLNLENWLALLPLSAKRLRFLHTARLSGFHNQTYFLADHTLTGLNR